MSGLVSFRRCGHSALLSAGPGSINEFCPPCAAKQPKSERAESQAPTPSPQSRGGPPPRTAKSRPEVRVTYGCGHVRLVSFGPARTSGEPCVRCQRSGRRLSAPAARAPILDFATFCANTPSLQVTWRDQRGVARLFLGELVADYWPKREKWHLISKNVRGQGFAELQRLLTPGVKAEASGELRRAPIGTTHRPARRSCTPPQLFVCDECQRRYRLGLPGHPTHDACNARLDLRA